MEQSVVQSGRTLRLGRRGQGFESLRSDQKEFGMKNSNNEMVRVYSGEKKVRGPLENPMPRRKMPKGSFGMVDAQFREMPEMVSQEWLVAHSKNPNHGKAKFRRTSVTFK